MLDNTLISKSNNYLNKNVYIDIYLDNVIIKYYIS